MAVIFESGLNEPPADWVELTEADISSATFQNTGDQPFYLQATTGDKPTTVDGSIEYPAAAKETNVTIASLFPGVSGADRLWAYANKQTTVMVSHAPTTNRTVTLSPSQSYTKARIAHSGNWLTGGAVTASGTDADYFEDAPTNSLTYEKWKPDALAATWEYDHGSDADCDYCAIAAHTMGTNGNTLEVQYYDGASWVDLIPASAITTDAPVLVLFTEQTRQRWRISISGGTVPTIGVIRFGKALQMQRAIYGGHTPVDMARQTKSRANISVTGEFLGRSKVRTELASSYAWQYLTADWVRTNWKPFQTAMEDEPFFVAWRPSDFGEVSYCQADQVAVPTNSGGADLMSVDLQVRALAYD